MTGGPAGLVIKTLLVGVWLVFTGSWTIKLVNIQQSMIARVSDWPQPELEPKLLYDL